MGILVFSFHTTVTSNSYIGAHKIGATEHKPFQFWGIFFARFYNKTDNLLNTNTIFYRHYFCCVLSEAVKL